MSPLTTARLAQVQNKLGDLMGRKVFFYSISVDPKNDSPERLREFGRAFHTGPGWLFLTGRPEAIRELRFRLGDRSPSLAEHRQELVIGNDATGEWTRSSALADIEQLAMTIRDMDPAWRNQPRPPGPGRAHGAGYVLENQPGSAMFRKLCSPCHTIGVGDRVGPDLRDVTARRKHEWLVRFIMDPRKLWLQRDPTTLALVAQYPGAQGTLMPRLGVTSNDAEDLIAYLDTQSGRLRPASTQALGAFEEHSHKQ
jgi:cytochrome c2